MKGKKNNAYLTLRFDDESIALLAAINSKLDAIVKKEGITVDAPILHQELHQNGFTTKATINISHSKELAQLDKELDGRLL